MSAAGTIVIFAVSLAGVVAAVLTVLAWLNRRQPGVFWFAVHAGGVTVFAFFGLSGLVAQTDSMTIWLGVLRIVTSFILVWALVLFLVTYLGYSKRLTQRPTIIAVAALSGLLLLIGGVPNESNLLFSALTVETWAGFTVFAGERTTLGNLLPVSSFILLFSTVGLVVQATAVRNQVSRSQGVILLIALLTPTVTALVAIGLHIPDGAPTVEIASVVSVAMYSWALYRHDFLTLSPATEQIGVERAFEDLGAGVLVVADTGTVLRVNETACELLGSDRAEIINDDISTALAPLGSPPLDSLPRDIEHEGRVYELTTATIGDGIGSTVMVRDITARKERQALERKNDRLEQFASIVSHDLRNPLGIARTYTDFAEDSGDPDDFEAIHTAHERMDTMITDLLTMARAETSLDDTTSITLTDHVDEAWETAQTDEATLSNELPAEFTVEGDPSFVRHIFENLFRNAVEHGSTSSRTESDNAVDHNEPPITVRVGPLEASAGFYIEDDGVGISEDDYDVVFDHGHTTSEEGSGLGLAIVSDVVEAHGWEISVTDGVDGGARFEIRTD